MIAVSSLGEPLSMGLPIIERIYPKASELSEILTYNPCPECTEVFHNTPNLEMHLAKCHRRETSRVQTPRGNSVLKQFYCPEAGCKYNGNHGKDSGIRFFTQHKYLKQHYIKVHMEKKFLCDQCGKGFATTQLRKRHLDECGLKFLCSCGAEYNTVPALLTHASRKGHTFIKSWTPARNRKVDKNDNVAVSKPSLIPPKRQLSETVLIKTAAAFSELRCNKTADIGVQTEPTAGHRRRRNKPSDTSHQTQTCEKRTRISSETQTVGEYHQRTKKNVTRRRKKSMETQTKVVEHTVVKEESSYSIRRDIGLPQLWFNSGTQTSSDRLFDDPLPSLCGSLFEDEPERVSQETNLFSDINSNSTDQFLSAFMVKEGLIDDDGKSCSIETQTEFSFESLFENYTDTLTNIETQTCHDLWDQYNNTCTQTCDDILLAFSDIETQTAWPDVSIETQTNHN